MQFMRQDHRCAKPAGAPAPQSRDRGGGFMRRPSHRALMAVASVALAVGVGACGGSSNSSSSSSSSSGGSGAGETTSSSAATDAAVKRYSAYVGGTAGAADSSKSPITFGLINDEGGVPSFPEGSTAANAAVKFLNEQLGGVGGHPVNLVTCLVA